MSSPSLCKFSLSDKYNIYSPRYAEDRTLGIRFTTSAGSQMIIHKPHNECVLDDDDGSGEGGSGGGGEDGNDCSGDEVERCDNDFCSGDDTPNGSEEEECGN
ncbi:MAG: hypothetical protein WBL44_15875 [Nitrososphaeraceae archaeon]